MLRVDMIRNKRNSIAGSTNHKRTKSEKKEVKTKLNEATTMRSQISVDQMARKLLDDAMYFDGPEEKIDSVCKSVRASKMWFEFIQKENVRKTKEVEMQARSRRAAKNKALNDYVHSLSYDNNGRKNGIFNGSKAINIASGDAFDMPMNDMEKLPLNLNNESGDGHPATLTKSDSGGIRVEQSCFEILSEVEADEVLYDDGHECFKSDQASQKSSKTAVSSHSANIENEMLKTSNGIVVSSASNHKSDVKEKENKADVHLSDRVISGWDLSYSQSECCKSDATPRDISQRRFENMHESLRNSVSNNLANIVQNNLSVDPSSQQHCFEPASYIFHECEGDCHANTVPKNKTAVEYDVDEYEKVKRNLFEAAKLTDGVADEILPTTVPSVTSSIYTDDRSTAAVKSSCSDLHYDRGNLTDKEYQAVSDVDCEYGGNRINLADSEYEQTCYDINCEYDVDSCSKCDILLFNSDDNKSATNCASRCSTESRYARRSKSAGTTHNAPNTTRSNGRVGSVVQSDGWRTGSDDECFRMPTCPAGSREGTIAASSETDLKQEEYIFLNTYSKDTGGGDDDPKGYYTRILRRYADPVVPPPFPYPAKLEPVNRQYYSRTKRSPRKRLTQLQQPTPHEANQVNFFKEKNERIARQQMNNKRYKRVKIPTCRSPVSFLDRNIKEMGMFKNRKEAVEERGVLKLPIIECTFRVVQQPQF